MKGDLLSGVVLVAVLAAGGALHAQEAVEARGPVPTAATRPFERPAIVRKAEAFYKRITATGFYPTIRGLAQGTGLGPGLTFWKARPFGTRVGIVATVGWNPQVWLLEGRLGRIPARPGDIPDRRFTLEALTADPLGGPNHRAFAFLEARRLNVTDDRFHFTLGAGGEMQAVRFERKVRVQDSTPKGETIPFDVIDQNIDAVGGYHFARGLAASARFGYVRTRTEFDPEELEGRPGLPRIPGVDDTTDFLRLQLDFIFDRRDVRNRARRGELLHLSWRRLDERGGQLYGFDRYEIDTRLFISTPSRRHTLAGRFVGTYDNAQDGRVVPFYFQRALGGGRTLRSYPVFRFRGTRVWAFSAEYRLGLLRWLELAAFYDGGKAWGDVEALGTQGYRDSAGVSARWVTEKDTIVRLDAAYGDEGWRLSARGSFAF
jgi:hypothetical protein